VLAD
jgi:hypothetical protein